ncbi:ATP-binding protein [Akkermansia muciniphila]|uniref:ATP-binding protein n=1 Tax=Akkermansia muciniphila TaxID=239935 RepID=UPI00319E4DCC
MSDTMYVSMEFDAKQMIHLLGNDLYDSPLAMLRENVQNAYDAILERKLIDSDFEPYIKINITNEQIVIEDNGIGMNKDILANNYWKAGNSGKNNPQSIAAGVVGHFGIGALANFGVCTKLEIQTRRYGEKTAYTSEAQREKINIKNSIPVTPIENQSIPYGTCITVTLDQPGSISVINAINYLRQYIEYIEIPVTINGQKFPQKKIDFIKKITAKEVTDSRLSYKLDIGYNNQFPLSVDILIYDIAIQGSPINGYLYLNTRDKGILGLRNGFGLASINVPSIYEFGGIVNLDNLVPTAGREAVSRESVSLVTSIVQSVESSWTSVIAKDPICDNYRNFLQYLYSHFNMAQASHINIKYANEDKYIRLGNITSLNASEFKYADGVDSTVLAKFKNSENNVLSISDSTYRKRIQRNYLEKIGVKSIPNNIQVIREYESKELTIDQFFIVNELRSIIEEDYYVKDFDVKFADISHMLNVFVTHDLNKGIFCIYISPNNSDIQRLISIRNDNYRLFTPLAKDFVRVVLYQQFSAFIPKGVKERTDYISRVLHNTKDEYIIPYEMTGTMDEMIGKLRADEITPEEFVKFAKAERNKHQQTINQSQVGDVSEVITNISNNTLNVSEDAIKNVNNEDIMPMPSILCLDVETKLRILKTDVITPVLQNNKMFMALTDKMVNQKRIFFSNPHTTRILWSMHRLIYIFTDVMGKNTLYYDLELTRKIPDSTGGKSIRSATILTKDKIFVPIVPELYTYFNLNVDEKLKFFVHFDEIENS